MIVFYVFSHPIVKLNTFLSSVGHISAYFFSVRAYLGQNIAYKHIFGHIETAVSHKYFAIK